MKCPNCGNERFAVDVNKNKLHKRNRYICLKCGYKGSTEIMSKYRDKQNP